MTSGTGIMSFGFAGYDQGNPCADRATQQRRAHFRTAAAKRWGMASSTCRNEGGSSSARTTTHTKVWSSVSTAVENDLTVNPLKEKKLTNVRAAGSDENIILTPPLRLTLEQSLEFINDDELVEVTPRSVRIRKRYLTENQRKREARA